MKRTAMVAGMIAAMAVAAAARAEGENLRLKVTLPGALAYYAKAGGPVDSVRPIDVYLTCENGKWIDAWGSAQTFNRNVHDGRVTAGRIEGDGIALTLELDVESDNWVKGGAGTWDLKLTRKGAAVEGTFGGTFKGIGQPHVVKDAKVTGAVLPANAPPAGFAPPAPGEHPRLLFRKADLPKVRQRAGTPLGKVIVEKLKAKKDPVSLAFLYQLTGDGRYAQEAFPAARAVMQDRSQGAFALGREWGYKTSRVGLAYDLCHDAWTPGQREETENYLDDILDLCLNRKHRVGTVNWSPGSNYTVVIHAGNGLAAMALMGEKGAAPILPIQPRTEPPRLKPAPDFRPEAGVPVVAMPLGKMATEWLYAGPFFLHFMNPLDPLESIGGVSKARPAAGTKVRFREQEIAFEKLSPETRPEAFGKGGTGEPKVFGVPKNQVAILTPELAKREQTRLFFYNVIEVEKAGWYRFVGNFWNAQCFVDGQRLGDKEIVHLAPGRYAFMVPVVLGAPTGQAYPWFVESTEEEAARLYADPKRVESYEAAKKHYDEALARYNATGGVNQNWIKAAKSTARWNWLNLEKGMGVGGFQGEGEAYTLECHHVIHDYALAFRNVHGKEVTGLGDISHFASRYIATTVLWEEKSAQGVTTKLFNQSYGRGEETLPMRYLPRALPLAVKDWQPAVQWFWLERAGILPDDVKTEAGAARLVAGFEGESEPLIQALLHYPLESEPQNPAKAGVPKAWESRWRGFYTFRNEWKDKNDIVAQIYAKDGESCGWNQAEAGCWQLWGLGRELAPKVNDAAGKTGSRWFDNVVMLPEDPIYANGRGRVSLYEGDPATGSGTVSFNMDEVYRVNEEYRNEKGEKATRLIDGGIRGMRSFAADYSGTSGAPAMFVVADKITGGKSKLWLMQLPPVPREGADYKLDIAGNAFTLAFKDMSLKATVVSPSGATIRKAEGLLKAHPLSHVPDASPNAITVQGADSSAGDFLVVLTVQRGEAPAVAASKPAMDASVTVGGQRVSFDGTKILVGK